MTFNCMFYHEKGNWYIDENNWAEYAVFRKEETKPFALVKDLVTANLIVDLLNEEYSKEGWKGDMDDLGKTDS